MKTAVEWLYNQQIEYPLGDWEYFLKKALEMEKQQIIDAVKSTDYIIGATNKESEEFAQQYYNETFKSN